MRRPSNIPAYVIPKQASPISQDSESDLDWNKVDQSLLEILETFCRSGSASSKFVGGRIRGNFVSKCL